MKTWKSMPTGKSSNELKAKIIRHNFRLMNRSVIKDFVYEGFDKQLVPFVVRSGKFSRVILQQRYDLSRTAFKNNPNYNEFNLSFVRDIETFIRERFFNASPRRIIPDDWIYINAQENIPFYFDPDDSVGLRKSRLNLKLFASPDIYFRQPWCEFDRDSNNSNSEVWLTSLVDINEGIRAAWEKLSNPQRVIYPDWVYKDTTSPVEFTLLDKNLDFYGIKFQQTINHWSRNLKINLKSVVDMNQALASILKRIGCKLFDSSFDYYSFSADAEKQFRQKFQIIDNFGAIYETSLECLSKGMNQNSEGGGQLPWNRGSSKITPNKIRKDESLMRAKGIVYLVVASSLKGHSYLKIGLTKKMSPTLRSNEYKVLAFSKRHNLLDIAILEDALLRVTLKDRPENYKSIKFPTGFHGGKSEIRHLKIYETLFVNKTEAEKRLEKMILKVKKYRDLRKPTDSSILDITSCLN